MSLLNDVLRDLQTRGAFGFEPASGLQPVAVPPTRHRWRVLVVPALAILLVASVIAAQQLLTDRHRIPEIANIMGEADSQPQKESDPAPPDSVVAEPATLPVPVPAKTATAGRDRRDVAAATRVTRGLTATAGRDRRDVVAATRITRGLTAMRSDDLARAEQLFREALVIDAGNGRVWSYLYSVLIRTSQLATAEETLQQGLMVARDPAPLAKLYARMLLDRGETETAVSTLRAHRPAASSDNEYDAFLAALLQQLGQHAQSLEIYRQLVTVDPTSGSWWIGLAISHDSLGNNGEALSAFQRAQRSAPLNSTLTNYARRRITELQAND